MADEAPTRSQSPGAEQGWPNLNPAYLTPRGECADCGSQFDPDETFTYRGLHFCAECVSELASWMLDATEDRDEDRYDWVGMGDPSSSGEPEGRS